MPVAVRFPDPRDASPEGVVAVGANLEPRTIMAAYRQGIFPWPAEGLPLLWFSPPMRGVLDFDRLHPGRTLARRRRRTTLELTVDRSFVDVIHACADAPRPGQEGTWITPDMCLAYTRLHQLGQAHSAEAWRDGELVGGVYGVAVDGAFSAESMFFREPYASRLALLHLIDHLARAGLGWLDIQVISPHLARMGAVEIPREEFLVRLQRTRRRGLRLF